MSMKKTYYLIMAIVLSIAAYGCKKDYENSSTIKEDQNLSLKASFDKQYAKSRLKSGEGNFNENFRTKIQWEDVTFRTADTAILRVKPLDDVKIYTNDSIPLNMAENLIIKATKNSKGEWDFVKVIYLPEYGEDLPSGFTGRIISEGYFDNNYIIAKYFGGHSYFATFNSDNPWVGRKHNFKLKAGLPGDPRCQPEEDGGTVTGYVEGQENVVWHRPKPTTPPVCVDDPILSGGGGGGTGVGGTPSDNQPARKMQDLPPAKFDWRLKLKTTEDFMKYLPKVEGIIKTNPDGSTMLDENLQGVPNPDAYNCHYYAFGENKDPNSFDPKTPKVIDYPDVSKFSELAPGDKIQVGDRVIYVGWPDSGTKLVLHSGIVTQVDANGYATEVSSKMGDAYGIIKHHPRDIPESYGLAEPSTQFSNGQLRYNREYYRPKK